MVKVLITGAAGLIGSHLAEALVGAGEEVVATFFKPTIDLATVRGDVAFTPLDVTDREATYEIIEKFRPDVIYHLAAQSLPTVSWLDPWTTLDVNLIGTVNVFEAVKDMKSASGYDPRIVVACSSAAYGASLTPERVPVDEDAPLLPLHPYGVSKVGQDLLTYQYHVNFGIRGVRARIFNCTGPRKRNDVVSDFGRSVVQALRLGHPVKVGNLETRRAIIDIRDMVAALILLSKSGADGEAFNICAENIVQIREVLTMYFEAVGRELPYEVDPKLLRPSDEPVIVGSTRKLREATGWSPSVPLRQTVRDVLDFELAAFERDLAGV
ncbi:GDP-mannose 4,6-dehydratase [Aquabacter sp. P-9]|uniref:GDP-mannose 4,6-dehydratase n=1 Tax=Aquabacter sediminis TaxID=3029197 RepID=UPI00237DCC29|nr:GDP-mannose 4,6-dehydratase [Aquabacter sp. P-9]MDE1569293.1 GDP-mannose 4,6-dehydratase [Aquabacter sp. P-9]